MRRERFLLLVVSHLLLAARRASFISLPERIAWRHSCNMSRAQARDLPHKRKGLRLR